MNRRAMTLLEVVVALTVAGAALAAGAAVLGFLTDQQSRNGAQAIASAGAVRAALREWMSEARLTTEGDAEFRGVNPSGMRHDAAGQPSDEITFVTSAPTQIGTTGTIVHIYMRRAEGDSIHGLVAELRPWRQDGVPVMVSLAPDASGVRMRYLSSVYGKRTWLDRWVSTSVLPAAIDVQVQFDSTRVATSVDRAAQALLSLPIAIPIGSRR
jgi:prepilin-type N-terminal cleavage/methylation domain-containing protein